MKHPVQRTSTALGLSLSLLQPGIAPAQEAAIDTELRALCGALPEGVLEQILEDAEAEEQAPAETPPPAEAPSEGHSPAPEAAAEPVAEPAPAAEPEPEPTPETAPPEEATAAAKRQMRPPPPPTRRRWKACSPARHPGRGRGAPPCARTGRRAGDLRDRIGGDPSGTDAKAGRHGRGDERRHRSRPDRGLPDRGPYRRGGAARLQPPAVRPAGGIGGAGADRVFRRAAGEHGGAGLWRALPPGADGNGGAAA